MSDELVLPETLRRLAQPALTWESQVRQYPRRGVPGITYMAGHTPLGPVDCLLWRDDRKTWVRGILNHYPQGAGRLERAGNVNVFVDPQWRRQGIASALLDEARRRWSIDLGQQQYSDLGAAFIRAYAQQRR